MAGCNGNSINGAVSLTSNYNGLVFGSNYVVGSATIKANTGGQILVRSNLITATLACSANTPAPANSGQGNTAGNKTGQCSAL